MRRTRLVLYVAAFVAWTATMVLLAAAPDAKAGEIAFYVAVVVTAAAALVGIAHAVVTFVRRWREGRARPAR